METIIILLVVTFLLAASELNYRFAIWLEQSGEVIRL
jgi:hypothetical protein